MLYGLQHFDCSSMYIVRYLTAFTHQLQKGKRILNGYRSGGVAFRRELRILLAEVILFRKFTLSSMSPLLSDHRPAPSSGIISLNSTKKNSITHTLYLRNASSQTLPQNKSSSHHPLFPLHPFSLKAIPTIPLKQPIPPSESLYQSLAFRFSIRLH